MATSKPKSTQTAAEQSGQRQRSYIEMIREASDTFGEKTALVMGGSERSYEELVRGGNVRARELKALGLKSGDRLGVLMPNSVDFVEILIGAAMIGVVIVPINTRFRTFEIRHVIADSRMTAIYSTDEIDQVTNFGDLLEEALPGLSSSPEPMGLSIDEFPALRSVVLLGTPRPGFVDRSLLRQQALEQPEPAAEEAPEAGAPLLLMYTSGTTANPKGCLLSSAAFLATATALADRYRIGTSDVWWCPLPMFHVGGIIFMTLVLSRGGLYVGMQHFTPEGALDLVERYQPTVFYSLFPPITFALIDHPRFSQTSFESVRYVFSVAPPDAQQKIQAAFAGAVLCSAFGMTETCGAVTFSLPDDPAERRLATCGTPLPGWTLRIVHPEERHPVGVGEHGEIEIKGDGLFDGYYNDPTLTAASFTADGYFKTGDIGSVDENGHIRFHGRFKDQLKVGGENVSALEVESFLLSHPAVKQAQVVGAPDDRYGEVVAAFIELMSGTKLSQAEVLDYCKGRIARYKIPHHVRFVVEWPMSATKVQKHKLRERIAFEIAEARANQGHSA